MKRRSIAVVAVVAILALAWIGGWFWLASYAESRADAAIQEMAERGVDVACADRSVGGFPFAIEVRCGPTTVAEQSSAAHVETPGASAGVSVFSPLTAQVALVSPVNIDAPALHGPAVFRFDRASLSTGLGMNGPRDYAFEASNLIAESNAGDGVARSAAAATAKGSLSPSAGGGSDIALQFSDLVATVGDLRIPAFNGSVTGEISVPPRALLSGDARELAPISARALAIRLDSGGARLDIDGDVAVDAEGIVDGTLIVRVAGAEQLPKFIDALPAQWRNLGNAVAAGVIAFGRPTTIDGAAGTELKVQVKRGETNIGPLPLTLPRLRL